MSRFFSLRLLFMAFLCKLLNFRRLNVTHMCCIFIRFQKPIGKKTTTKNAHLHTHIAIHAHRFTNIVQKSCEHQYTRTTSPPHNNEILLAVIRIFVLSLCWCFCWWCCPMAEMAPKSIFFIGIVYFHVFRSVYMSIHTNDWLAHANFDFGHFR